MVTRKTHQSRSSRREVDGRRPITIPDTDPGATAAEVAYANAEAGWAVLPARKTKRGLEPIVDETLATRDPAQITAWFTEEVRHVIAVCNVDETPMVSAMPCER